jgi:hypothetical protein
MSKAAYLDIVCDEMVRLKNGYDLREHMHYV